MVNLRAHHDHKAKIIINKMDIDKVKLPSPEGYQEESKRISQYITGLNEIIYELDETLSNFTDDVNKGVFPKINIKSIINKSDVVNGREQKKIEEFLDKKNIKTKAFGREH